MNIVDKIDSQELEILLINLEKYICFIFDNDKSFIDSFCKGNVMNLLNVAFTDCTCQITYCLYCGQHVCDKIDVVHVFNWIYGITNEQ
jgi:hypothetical protein